MLVDQGNFDVAMEEIEGHLLLALDTETTGLRPYHGDRLFSLILATPDKAWYFNFHQAPDIPLKACLTPQHLQYMDLKLFRNHLRVWDLQNAKYDMHILWQEGVELAGEIWCTKVHGRILYNDHMKYSLADQLKLIGLHKDDAVKAYVKKHKLWAKIPLPGKKDTYEVQHYDKVPFELILPYGELDGTGTASLGLYQRNEIGKNDEDSIPGKTLGNVCRMEQRLTKTVFRMERVGVMCDIPYCQKAVAYEEDRAEKYIGEFRKITGHQYKASNPLFQEVFASEKEKWGTTKKGAPSFEADILETFTHPAASLVLGLRDAKSKADFYNTFIFRADAKGVVHPDFDPSGTKHGRFSSREPNFQNLTADEDDDLEQEFIVRRALIPRPGFVFIMPDYDQMEYRFMLETACDMFNKESPLTALVKTGLDVHEATSQSVQEKSGKQVSRKICKIANFLTLYGGGPGKLAKAVGVSYAEACKIREAIFHAAPEIQDYIERVMAVANTRKYITNWLGRRCYFPNSRFTYKAPNYHISGGCADVVKTAMNEIDELLQGYHSRLVMTVHDELPIEVHESELASVPHAVKQIMENVYPSKYLKLTTGMEWSAKSLGDKIKGFPI
jgi:DNA polymerase I-like protein with 3'-5' exonuclease and polymerase domains